MFLPSWVSGLVPVWVVWAVLAEPGCHGAPRFLRPPRKILGIVRLWGKKDFVNGARRRKQIVDQWHFKETRLHALLGCVSPLILYNPGLTSNNLREGCEKSKWKFKMAFVTRGTIRDMRVPKVLLPPPSKIGLLAQKRQNIFHVSVSTLKIAQKRFPQLRFTYIGAQQLQQP